MQGGHARSHCGCAWKSRKVIRDEFPRSHAVSGIGGVETGASGPVHLARRRHRAGVHRRDEVRLRCVKRMLRRAVAFMEKHKFRTLADFKGHSLQYFTTHYDLVHGRRRPQDAQKRQRLPRPTASRSRPTTNGEATISCTRRMPWRGVNRPRLAFRVRSGIWQTLGNASSNALRNRASVHVSAYARDPGHP